MMSLISYNFRQLARKSSHHKKINNQSIVDHDHSIEVTNLVGLRYYDHPLAAIVAPSLRQVKLGGLAR